MAIVIIAIFVLYWVLVLWLWVGWEKITLAGDGPEVAPMVSIIVAMRNEERLITGLLQDFTCLEYDIEKLDIILVNDHSTDRTVASVNEFLHNMPFQTRIIGLENEAGKKNAIAKGIVESRADIILTTDADCRVRPGWVSAMASTFADDSVMLVSGPVSIDGKKSFFGRLQSIEFASLIGSGAATMTWGFATMANAANMAFRKQVVNDKPLAGSKKSSGDDMFRLHRAAADYPEGLQYCKHKEAIVNTLPADGLASFFKQRHRWAGKWTSYNNLPTILLAIFIFLINLATIVLPALAVLDVISWITAFNLFLARALLEFWFLRSVQKFLGGRILLHEFIILVIIYPIYVVVIGILSNVKGNTWKGRPLK